MRNEQLYWMILAVVGLLGLFYTLTIGNLLLAFVCLVIAGIAARKAGLTGR